MPWTRPSSVAAGKVSLTRPILAIDKKHCKPFAEEKVAAAKKKAEEDKAWVKRKKPKLVVNYDMPGS